MSEEKRNCIFTNMPATAKLTLASSKHNWTKSVPCTKEFLEYKKSNKLNDLEFKLIETFFQKELALLRADYFENKMQEIRKLLDLNDYYKIKIEDIEISIPEKSQSFNLTKEEDKDTLTVVSDKKNFWE